MKTSMSDVIEYVSRCEQCAIHEKEFNLFRKTEPIQTVIDGVEEKAARKYIGLATKICPELRSYFDKFRASDKHGSPVVYNLGEYGKFNGSTARYIYFLAEMIELFGSLDAMNIVEIGGGYGGQCKIIMDCFEVKSYTIVDLLPVLKLQHRYLNKFDYKNIAFKQMKELKKNYSYDLIISNYAFTECHKKIQETYINKIVTKSKRGYIKCNFMSHNIGFPQLTKKELLKHIKRASIFPHILNHPGCFTLIWNNSEGKIKNKFKINNIFQAFTIERWFWELKKRIWIGVN